jgi:hypothetical protein
VLPYRWCRRRGLSDGGHLGVRERERERSVRECLKRRKKKYLFLAGGAEISHAGAQIPSKFFVMWQCATSRLSDMAHYHVTKSIAIVYRGMKPRHDCVMCALATSLINIYYKFKPLLYIYYI